MKNQSTDKSLNANIGNVSTDGTIRNNRILVRIGNRTILVPRCLIKKFVSDRLDLDTPIVPNLLI